MKIVSSYFDISVETLKKKNRKHEIVLARQMCMTLIKSHTKLSLKQVGELFEGDTPGKGKDHTTVIHAKQTLKDLMDTDETVRTQFYHLQSLVHYDNRTISKKSRSHAPITKAILRTASTEQDERRLRSPSRM